MWGIGYREVVLYPTHSSAHGTYTLPHPVLTSGGGHRNTHVWQAGGTHITGMLSCFRIFGEKAYFVVNQPSKTISLRLGKVQINFKYIYAIFLMLWLYLPIS